MNMLTAPLGTTSTKLNEDYCDYLRQKYVNVVPLYAMDGHFAGDGGKDKKIGKLKTDALKSPAAESELLRSLLYSFSISPHGNPEGDKQFDEKTLINNIDGILAELGTIPFETNQTGHLFKQLLQNVRTGLNVNSSSGARTDALVHDSKAAIESTIAT